MTFWDILGELPQWFQMVFLGAGYLGLFFVVYELANRKLRIDKSGVTFDRLREKKPFLIRLIEMAGKRKREKISIQDVNT